MLLADLRSGGPSTPSDIADRVGLERGKVHALLCNLRHRGLLISYGKPQMFDINPSPPPVTRRLRRNEFDAARLNAACFEFFTNPIAGCAEWRTPTTAPQE